MSQSAAVDAEIVIAAADSGLNMLIDYTVKPEGGESFSSSVYVIDGAMYTYDEEGFYVLNPSSVDFSALPALAGLDFGAEESGIAEMLALLLDEYGTVEEAGLDLVTPLLRFADYVNQNGVVCGEITGFTAGYSLDTQSEPTWLVPTWLVETDNGSYHWNTATGAITPVS